MLREVGIAGKEKALYEKERLTKEKDC